MAIRRRAKADHSGPACSLIQFAADDGVELSGLLYEPKRSTRRAAIWLHGSGGASVFDSRRTNIVAEELTRAGMAFFPFNNRGAHIIRYLKRAGRRKSVGGGMALEKIRDAVRDIDGAIRFLRSRGYRELYLIGHSTGANKIVLYDHYRKRNAIRRYVLLSGGDDTGGIYAALGARRFRASLARARQMIRAGRGEDLIPKDLLGYLMSWQSFYDMANPDGDYNTFPFLEVMRGVKLSKRRPFRYAEAISKPTFVIYGEADAYLYDDASGCMAAFADAVGPKENFQFVLVEDADHGFKGHERELGMLVADWLS